MLKKYTDIITLSFSLFEDVDFPVGGLQPRLYRYVLLYIMIPINCRLSTMQVFEYDILC